MRRDESGTLQPSPGLGRASRRPTKGRRAVAEDPVVPPDSSTLIMVSWAMTSSSSSSNCPRPPVRKSGRRATSRARAMHDSASDGGGCHRLEEAVSSAAPAWAYQTQANRTLANRIEMTERACRCRRRALFGGQPERRTENGRRSPPIVSCFAMEATVIISARKGK